MVIIVLINRRGTVARLNRRRDPSDYGIPLSSDPSVCDTWALMVHEHDHIPPHPSRKNRGLPPGPRAWDVSRGIFGHMCLGSRVFFFLEREISGDPPHLFQRISSAIECEIRVDDVSPRYCKSMPFNFTMQSAYRSIHARIMIASW